MNRSRGEYASSVSHALSLSLALPAIALLLAAQSPLFAQAPPVGGGQSGGTSSSKDTKIEDKMVSLDAEQKRLVEILPDLMKGVGADFSIDSSIKQVRVSIHISQSKLKDALDGLMRACDGPVHYKVESGLYHFMAGYPVPDRPAAPASEDSAVRRGRGPLYNGGDPIAVAVSDLFQFLSGSEPALSGKGAYPNSGPVKAGSGSMSGSRKYSEYGFLNGRITSSSFMTPDTGNPQSSTLTGGYGYFGPFGNNGGGHL